MARFQRNPCYAPDWSGEFNFAHQRRNGCTAVDSHDYAIASTPQLGVLKAGEEKTFTFDFAKPIPLNAIDWFLQVVYRGPVGEEKQGIVAVWQDLPEPTAVSFMNLTDYFWIDGVFYRPDEVLAQELLKNRLERNGRPGY